MPTGNERSGYFHANNQPHPSLPRRGEGIKETGTFTKKIQCRFTSPMRVREYILWEAFCQGFSFALPQPAARGIRSPAREGLCNL